MTSFKGSSTFTVFTCIVACSIVSCSAGGLRGTLGEVSTTEVDTSLISELVGVVDTQRPLQLEAALRTTYDSLPKNAFGNLDHQSVRYVLHRMFVQRHGWFIKGLEPDGADANESDKKAFLGDEWVPSYLQQLLEKRLGSHGMNLRELSTVASTLERLIHMEAGKTLQVAYEAHGFSTDSRITQEEAQRVINTYMIDFLEPPFPNASLANATRGTDLSARARFKEFTLVYPGWADVEEWLRGVEMPHLGATANTFFGFADTQRIIEDIGEQYGHFNDLECRSLKTTLMDMEDKQPGRVWLSDFYKKSLHSHWQFNEKIGYLRQIGALDETDANGPQVILSNYIGSRPNCLEASHIYAICCRNECEDLMGRIEQDISASQGDVDRIATIVSALPSDTVEAPRVLSDRLMRRLNQVAASNGGKVPLHGRLFAQWMHHAFPRECPYPHESGTVNPMTPDEWLKSTGHGSLSASEAEILAHSEAMQLLIIDDADQAREKSELPWSHTEELLVTESIETSTTTPSLLVYSRLFLAFLVISALILLLHSPLKNQRPGGSFIGYEDAAPVKPKLCSQTQGNGILVAFCVLSVFVLVRDLLDPAVFIGAVAVGGVWFGFQKMVAQRSPVAKKII